MKKLIALVLALVMVLAVAAASAATITISRDESYSADADNKIRTLKYFKVFDATKSGEAVSYTLPGTSPWVSVLTAKKTGTDEPVQTYFTLTPNADSSLYYVTAKDITSGNAATAANWLHDNIPTGVTETELTYDANNHQWKAETVDIGYYVIVSYDNETGNVLTESTNLIAWTTDITKVEKNTYPKIDKKQKDTDSSSVAYADANVNVKVGDTIYYSVEVDVPADASLPIHVTDTMTTGLTFQSDSMRIKVGTGEPATSHTDVTAATASGTTWAYDIAITDNTKGKKVVFTFTAIVNANAIVDTGKKNTVDLQYGNTNYHQTDHVDYQIYATGALKFDGATATVDGENNLVAKEGKTITALAGAEFKLQVSTNSGTTWTDLAVEANKTGDAVNYYLPKTASGTAATIITPANGKVYIRGLEGGTGVQYRLVETKAPQGFNLMNPAETAAMTLVADTYTDDPTATLSSVTDPTLLKIANNKGTELPSTGGIGTTIFYIVGGLLVIGAAVILVARRKAHE